jgi:hypothetical protein
MRAAVAYRLVLVSLVVVVVAGCQGTIGETPDGGDEADAINLPDSGDPDAGSDIGFDTGDAADLDAGNDAGVDACDAADPGGGDIQPDQDSDGDGLPDSFELAAGDLTKLDPDRADSDGDGLSDADEDYDGDGLTNIEELAAGRLSFKGDVSAPNPFRLDLLVELDCMADRCPSDQLLAEAALTWADVDLSNPDGSSGVGLHIVIDETGLADQQFDGSFEQRWSYFAAHGPHFDDGGSPPLPLGHFVHVMAVHSRQDIPDRGGDTVAGPDDEPEKSGVFIYHDVIYNLFPACGRTTPPVWPDITPEEMVVSTLVHELGHTLQLGHDTDVGGSTNYYNVMSVPQSCTNAQMRTHGVDNDDPLLGSTAQVNAPRFSSAAAALMDFSNILSVDTAALVPQEM